MASAIHRALLFDVSDTALPPTSPYPLELLLENVAVATHVALDLNIAKAAPSELALLLENNVSPFQVKLELSARIAPPLLFEKSASPVQVKSESKAQIALVAVLFEKAVCSNDTLDEFASITPPPAALKRMLLTSKQAFLIMMKAQLHPPSLPRLIHLRLC